jgi:hypothetical protein
MQVLGEKSRTADDAPEKQVRRMEPRVSYVPTSCLHGLRRSSAATHSYPKGGHDRECYERHGYQRRDGQWFAAKNESGTNTVNITVTMLLERRNYYRYEDEDRD